MIIERPYCSVRWTPSFWKPISPLLLGPLYLFCAQALHTLQSSENPQNSRLLDEQIPHLLAKKIIRTMKKIGALLNRV